MSLGLAIWDDTRSQQEREREEPRSLGERRLTEVSEFDIDAYLYSDPDPPLPERSRWSTDSEDGSLRVPSLVHYAHSSDGSHPTTPEDANFARRVGHPAISQTLYFEPTSPIYGVPIVVNEFERKRALNAGEAVGKREGSLQALGRNVHNLSLTPRSVSTTAPAPIPASPALVPNPFTPKSPPAKRKSSSLSLQSLGRSLRRSMSIGRTSSTVSSPGSPASTGTWRSRKSTDARTSPSVGASSIPPSPAMAKDAAHAVVAMAARSSAKRPMRSATIVGAGALPSPLPLRDASLATAQPSGRPRTAPTASTAEQVVLPPLPSSPAAGLLPPRPLMPASARVLSSAFINPWTSPLPVASADNRLAASPCGNTLPLPMVTDTAGPHGGLWQTPITKTDDGLSPTCVPPAPMAPMHRAPLQPLEAMTPGPQRKLSFAPLPGSRRQSRSGPSRARRMSSIDASRVAVIDFRRRASSFSLGDASRRGTMCDEVAWRGAGELDRAMTPRSALSSPFGFPTTPCSEDGYNYGGEDVTLFDGAVNAAGTGQSLTLRNPWTGTIFDANSSSTSLSSANIPPVPPVEVIEAALLRERRNTRTSSLPCSVSSFEPKSVGAGGMSKRVAPLPRGLRVSIDIGVRTCEVDA